MERRPIQQLAATAYVTNAAATIYTNPYTAGTNGIAIITGFILANTDSSDRTFTMYNLPSGGVAAGGNTIIPGVTIKANNTWFKNNGEGLWIVPAGGFLQVLADVTNKLTFTLYGREIS